MRGSPSDSSRRSTAVASASISPRLKLVIDMAQAEADRLKDEYVSTEHLFIAIAGESRPFACRAAAAQAGLTRDRVFEALTRSGAASA